MYSVVFKNIIKIKKTPLRHTLARVLKSHLLSNLNTKEDILKNVDQLMVLS